MNRSWMGLAGLAWLLVSGCASSSSGLPCDRCDWVYVSAREKVIKAHPQERRVYCIIDGKVVDCAKNPGECPECTKQSRE